MTGARTLIGITLFATLCTLLVGAGVAWFVLVVGSACLVWGLVDAVSR
jgi:hypothetical protein